MKYTPIYEEALEKTQKEVGKDSKRDDANLDETLPANMSSATQRPRREGTSLLKKRGPHKKKGEGSVADSSKDAGKRGLHRRDALDGGEGRRSKEVKGSIWVSCPYS